MSEYRGSIAKLSLFSEILIMTIYQDFIFVYANSLHLCFLNRQHWITVHNKTHFTEIKLEPVLQNNITSLLPFRQQCMECMLLTDL